MKCPYCFCEISPPPNIRNNLVMYHGMNNRRRWDDDNLLNSIYGCGKALKIIYKDGKWLTEAFMEPDDPDPDVKTRFFLKCCYPDYQPMVSSSPLKIQTCGEGCFYRKHSLEATSASDPKCLTLGCYENASIYKETLVCKYCALPGMIDYDKYHEKCKV